MEAGSKPRKVKNIPPHGGVLVNREAEPDACRDCRARAAELPRVRVLLRERCDLEMLAIGAYSPLTGFMDQADYLNVVNNMRLANGLIWSVPITLGVSADKAAALKVGQDIALYDELGDCLAIMHLHEKYTRD